MKKTILLTLFISLIIRVDASNNDSIKTFTLDDVTILRYKETNHQNSPVSSTLLNKNTIEKSQISSIKDVSGFVPNFFIPDYGSAMSNAVYIRGIGSRNSGQTISLYLDNVPYLDKSAFDFELYDISQIEVLRGPQGALYGRNAMGGIVNIYTLSPVNYQGTKLLLSAGNYGYLQGKITHYRKLNNKLSLMAGGYYGRQNGFYTNDFSSKKVDGEQSAGGRAKLIWDIKSNFKMEFSSNFDYIDQGAFPYGLYNSADNTTANPNFNNESNYTRKTLNNSISANYTNKRYILSASLSHQYFNDVMNMDQDFTPLSIFTVQQNQKQHMINGEIFVKSTPNKSYQWLVGANGFTQNLDMYVPVSFRENGVQAMLQPSFTKAGMTITSQSFDIPGWYDNKRNGGALFHQSTLSDLCIEGLSLTVGVRLDAEKVLLDYNTNASLNVNANRNGVAIPMHLYSDLKGSVDTTFVKVLPKVALKYEWNKQNFLYASVSRGYKSGGFNVQMLSDMMSQKFMASMAPNGVEPDVKHGTLYHPENSWDYELGFSNSFFKNKLKTSLTLFYMNISGLQLTEFIASGTGRKLTNAGTSSSTGLEAAVHYFITDEFNISANYGHANAIFKHYSNIVTVNGTATEIDYAGKHVPYAPVHTLNGGVNYNKKMNGKFIQEIYTSIFYRGIGKIYWTEMNDISQDFYHTVDAKVGIKRKDFSIECWGKNLLNSEYNAFYFKSFGKTFFQKGKPLQFGVKMTYEF